MKDILDNNYSSIKNLDKENILWQGSPISQPSFITTFVSASTKEKIKYLVLAIPYVLLIAGTSYVIYLLLLKGDIDLLSLTVLIIFLTAFVITQILEYIQKQKTTYYILETGIYFQLSDWKKDQNDFIPFEGIERVNVLPNEAGEGDLIIYTNESVSLTSNNFSHTPSKTPPTLTNIKDVKEVGALIRSKIR